MDGKLTRRQWAVAMGAAAAVPAPAQVEAKAELLEEARQAVERNRKVLRAYRVPVNTEPAFRFEA